MATPNSNIADHLPSVARLLAASRPPPEPVHQSLVQPGYRNLRPKPEQVYNPKNPRAFPNGRLELDIKKQRCIMGRDTFMNLQAIEGLPVIPIDVDIVIRRRDSLRDPSATKVVGWMIGSIVQVGRIDSEGWDMHNVCQRVTPNVEAMALQLYNSWGKFVDPAKGSTEQDVARSLAGDALFIEAMFIRSRYRGYGLSLMAIAALIENLTSFHFDNVLLSPVPMDMVVLRRVNNHVFHAKRQSHPESKSTSDAPPNADTPGETKSSDTAPVAEPQDTTTASTAEAGASKPVGGSSTEIKVDAGGGTKTNVDDATPRPKRTKEERVAARSKACKSLTTHFERMGFSRWSTEAQENAPGGIPIWGICSFHKRPPIHRILPHLYTKPTSANPSVQDDEDNVTEEEDLMIKGGWASDPEEDAPPKKSEQEEQEEFGKIMRWTPFRRFDEEAMKGLLDGLGVVEGLGEDGSGMEAEEDAVELDDSELTPTSLRLAEALHNYYLKTMGCEPMVPDEDVEAVAEQLASLKTSTSTSISTPQVKPSRKGKEKCTDPEPEFPAVMEVAEAVKAVRRRPPQCKRCLGASQKMPDGRALKKKMKMSEQQELPGLGIDNGAEAGSSGSAT